MIVEHEFITTLEKEETLVRAGQFLAHAGFRPGASTSDTIETATSKKRRHRPASKLRQHASVEFDRGRVQVAVGITRRRHKLKTRHRNLLMGIALGLEQFLCKNVPLHEAAEPWAIAENTIRRRRRRANIIGITIVLLLLASLITFIVLIASYA